MLRSAAGAAHRAAALYGAGATHRCVAGGLAPRRASVGEWWARGGACGGLRALAGKRDIPDGFDFYPAEHKDVPEMTSWRTRHQRLMSELGDVEQHRDAFDTLGWMERVAGHAHAQEAAAGAEGDGGEADSAHEVGDVPEYLDSDGEIAPEELEQYGSVDELLEAKEEELGFGRTEEEKEREMGKLLAALERALEKQTPEAKAEAARTTMELERDAPLDYDYQYKDPHPLGTHPPTSHVRPGDEFVAEEVPTGIPHLQTLNNPDFFHKVLKVGRHAKPTKGGRVFSFSVLMLVGNGAGAVGIGYGKALSVPLAMEKSRRDADRNLVTIDRVYGRTISHMVKVKFRRSFVMLKPAPEGHGLRCSNLIRQVCKAAGIRDIAAKTHGSRITHNLLRAILKGLQRSVHPEVKARQLGLKTFDHHRIWRQHEIFKQY